MSIVTVSDSKVIRLPRPWFGPAVRLVGQAGNQGQSARVIRLVPRTPSAA